MSRLLLRLFLSLAGTALFVHLLPARAAQDGWSLFPPLTAIVASIATGQLLLGLSLAVFSGAVLSLLPATPLHLLPLAAAQRLACGPLVLDRGSRRAYVGATEATLTPKAVALLEYMMTHPDELLSRERLLDAVWGWDYPAGTRTVDTRVAELRRALGDDPSDPQYVETVPGQGYRFVGQVEAAS